MTMCCGVSSKVERQVANVDENVVVTVRGMVGRTNKQGKEGLRAYHWNLEVDLWKTKMKR